MQRKVKYGEKYTLPKNAVLARCFVMSILRLGLEGYFYTLVRLRFAIHSIIWKNTGRCSIIKVQAHAFRRNERPFVERDPVAGTGNNM